MPENVNKCPFSQSGCRNCPIYRGRHNYIMPKDGDGVPQPRVLKKAEIDWQERFKEVLQNREDDVPDAEEALRLEPQETNIDGGEKESKKYRIGLTVLDRETGERRVCTISEASTWDWENREKVRSIGPWHIYSFERLLQVLAHKAQAGCEEVELIEAPFYMGC
ncbi:MAG: hypothetical protein ABSC19_18575 [Syntrophorhabdales bacterium]|jgi:hypothetical protein